MSEKSQVVHMIIRVCRLAAERWGMTLAQVVEVMTPADALGYILRNSGLFHMEEDETVLGDFEEYLAPKGVRPDAA